MASSNFNHIPKPAPIPIPEPEPIPADIVPASSTSSLSNPAPQTPISFPTTSTPPASAHDFAAPLLASTTSFNGSGTSTPLVPDSAAFPSSPSSAPIGIPGRSTSPTPRSPTRSFPNLNSNSFASSPLNPNAVSTSNGTGNVRSRATSRSGSMYLTFERLASEESQVLGGDNHIMGGVDPAAVGGVDGGGGAGTSPSIGNVGRRASMILYRVEPASPSYPYPDSPSSRSTSPLSLSVAPDLSHPTSSSSPISPALALPPFRRPQSSPHHPSLGSVSSQAYNRASVLSTGSESVWSITTDSKYPQYPSSPSMSPLNPSFAGGGGSSSLRSRGTAFTGSMPSELMRLVPYAYDPTLDDDAILNSDPSTETKTKELFDPLHDLTEQEKKMGIDGEKVGFWRGTGAVMTQRGLSNIGALVVLIGGLMALFIVYPATKEGAILRVLESDGGNGTVSASASASASVTASVT